MAGLVPERAQGDKGAAASQTPRAGWNTILRPGQGQLGRIAGEFADPRFQVLAVVVTVPGTELAA